MLSEVGGDRLDVIASGPALPDPTMYQDCLEIIGRYDLLTRLPVSVRVHLQRGQAGELAETPKANDSYHFFHALDDLLITGPTGTNVMDMHILLVG